MEMDQLDIEVLGETMYLSRNRNAEGEIFYLDTHDGSVTSISEEVLNIVLGKDESLLKTIDDCDKYIAELIAFNEGNRFIRVPQIEPIGEFYWMAYFTDMISGPVHETLRKVVDVSALIDGFRNVLQQNPAERKLWSHFLAQKKREEARAWAAELGIPVAEPYFEDLQSVED